MTNQRNECRRVLLEIRSVETFYENRTELLQNLSFEKIQISFSWQGRRKMIGRLVRYEGVSLFSDPRMARIPQAVSTDLHLASEVCTSWPPDTLIRERVLGILTLTPPGIKFWRHKIRFYPAGYRKTATATKVPICRAISLWCENEVFENEDSSKTV